jgi:hypothetical protein
LLTDNWIPETRNRLAQRRAKKPDTKSGQIWALWPEISRSRRKEAVLRRAEAESAFFRAAISEEPQASSGGKRANSKSPTGNPPSKAREETEEPTDDPMAGAIRALDKARRRDIRDIHGDGDPSGKNLI